VFLLRPGHPRQTVEQQGVVVAGCQALQLGPRSMQDDDPKPADL
jgi:hypothetical protein